VAFREKRAPRLTGEETAHGVTPEAHTEVASSDVTQVRSVTAPAGFVKARHLLHSVSPTVVGDVRRAELGEVSEGAMTKAWISSVAMGMHTCGVDATL
jgi:hypothetical protein